MKFYHFDEIRDQLEDGDLVFMAGKRGKIIQQLVMFFTLSKLYHVGVAFWIPTTNGRRLMLVEATGKSHRRIVSLSYYRDYNLAVVKAPKPWSEMIDTALEQVGEVRYGFVEAAYIGIRETALKVFNIKLPSRDLPFEVCSSFVAGLLEFEDKIISPQTLFDVTSKMTSEL